MTTYTGQNRQTIIDRIQQSGSLNGFLKDVTGRNVTTVSFELINGDLVFKMANREFDNATNALIALHSELAMPTRQATGSKDGTAGNAASDIIGQYRIYPHIHFGNETLADIVGSVERAWDSSSKVVKRTGVPRKAVVKQIAKFLDERPAKSAFFKEWGGKYDYALMKQLVAKYGKSTVERDMNHLTIGELELRYGL